MHAKQTQMAWVASNGRKTAVSERIKQTDKIAEIEKFFLLSQRKKPSKVERPIIYYYFPLSFLVWMINYYYKLYYKLT